MASACCPALCHSYMSNEEGKSPLDVTECWSKHGTTPGYSELLLLQKSSAAQSMCDDEKEFWAGMAGGTRMALQCPPYCQISNALVHKSSQLAPTTQCWPWCLDTISQRPEVHTSHVRSKSCATLSRPSIILSGSCRGIREPHAFRTLAHQPYSITQGTALLVKCSFAVLFSCLIASTNTISPGTGSMSWKPGLVFLKKRAELTETTGNVCCACKP